METDLIIATCLRFSWRDNPGPAGIDSTSLSFSFPLRSGEGDEGVFCSKLMFMVGKKGPQIVITKS
jgi:hypothetical protein